MAGMGGTNIKYGPPKPAPQNNVIKVKSGAPKVPVPGQSRLEPRSQVTPKGQHLTVPKPGAKGVAAKPKPVSPGGGVRPAGAPPVPGLGNFGLNVNDKTPYNTFAQPKTQGQFNQQVLNAAAPGYQPQLNQNAADVAAENAAGKQRVADLKGIYNQYGSQAQSAFNETRNALTAMIGQNATGDTAQNGVLNAALNSAEGPGSQTAAMMGSPTPMTDQAIAPYESAAQGAQAGTGTELKGLAGGLLSTAGANVGNAAMEGEQQKDIESTRHLAAQQSNQQSRDTIVQGIPAIIEKAREQLVTDIQNAQGLKFQQTLANKQFGLSSKSEADQTKLAKGQLKLSTLTQKQTNALNRTIAANNAANAKVTQGQNQQTIDLNKKSIESSAALAKSKLGNALAKVQGQRQANAVKFLAGWVQPTASELQSKTTTNAQGQTIHTKGIDPKTWHRDVGSALKTLMSTYGLDLKTALSLMSGLTTPIGGGVHMTVGQWASTFLSRQLAAEVKKMPQLAQNPAWVTQSRGFKALQSVF